jgi:hypothetical protein
MTEKNQKKKKRMKVPNPGVNQIEIGAETDLLCKKRKKATDKILHFNWHMITSDVKRDLALCERILIIDPHPNVEWSYRSSSSISFGSIFLSGTTGEGN